MKLQKAFVDKSLSIEGDDVEKLLDGRSKTTNVDGSLNEVCWGLC